MLTHDSEMSAGESALRRGVSAARAGLRSVAATQFERAAESSPDDPNVWLWLAWVSNSPDNTIRCLERVLELSPGHATAIAGLAWARGLSHDAAPEPIVTPTSEIVIEGVVPSDPAVEPAALSQETFTTDVTPVQDSAEEPTTSDEAHAEPAFDVVSDPQLGTWESASPNVESVEQPLEPVTEMTAQQSDDRAAPELPRRRWSDLVQQNVESLTDAAAWPSLVLPPLPSVVPPPLPSITTQAEVDREPFAQPRPQEATANSAPSTEPTMTSDLATENHTEVEALTTSFNPPAEVASTDDRPLVMVVDDSPTVRKLVSLTLERRGYRVISAFDGVAAIKELGSCRPDLILLDINMPRLDGYRLCKLIKKHEATQEIPVVMLSGKDGMFDKLRGRLVGCSDYITKPFEADALTQKVSKYLTSASSSL